MKRSSTSTLCTLAAALAGALVLGVSCSSDQARTDPSTAPAREPSTPVVAPSVRRATTTAAATTTTTAAGAAVTVDTSTSAIGSISTTLPNPGPVEAGTYTLAALRPPVVIDIGDDWWAGWDHGDRIPMPDGVVALEHRLTSGFVRLAFWDTTNLKIAASQRPDVRTYVRELIATTGLTERAVVIGGADATRFDFLWTGDFKHIIRIPRAGFVLATDEPQHWIVLDTADGQLLINWTVENAVGADLEAEAEALIDPILTSLR